MNDCALVRDLLPLYADGLTGPETAAWLEDHLNGCEACRALLEKMRTPVTAETPVDDGFQKALRRQKRRHVRNIVLAVLAALLAAALCLGILWSKGVFYVVDRQASPDGTIRTTVYSRDLLETIPKKGGFTLVDEGRFRGRTIYRGTFEGLWWSQDSQYQVVSLVEDGVRYLSLTDYVRNVCVNLSHYLENAVYDVPEFETVPGRADGDPRIDFRFLQWSQYDSNMLIYYDFVDLDGVDRDGYFWYDYVTGHVTGVMELPVQAVTGTVKERGEGFYVMDLDALTEEGNVLEFVFYVSPATALRNTDALEPGDHVQVVYRGSEDYAARPWEQLMTWQTTEHQTGPTAISVTAIP